MGNKPISFKDKDGNFVSAADVWNPAREEAAKHPELNEETEQV